MVPKAWRHCGQSRLLWTVATIKYAQSIFGGVLSIQNRTTIMAGLAGGFMRLLKRSVILIALIITLVGSLVAQEKLTHSAEVLFGNPERANPRISPDGTQMGYLAPVNGVLNVWIRTWEKATTAP